MYLTRDLSEEYRIIPHQIWWHPSGQPRWAVKNWDANAYRIFYTEAEAIEYAAALTKEYIRRAAELETGLELVP